MASAKTRTHERTPALRNTHPVPRNPIPRPVHLVNEALAFVLELAALASLGFWGASVGPNLVAKLALGIGAPLILIVIWALFCAPKARVKLPLVPLVALRTVLLLAAAAAVLAAGWNTGWVIAAIVFALVILLNAAVTLMDRDALVQRPLA